MTPIKVSNHSKPPFRVRFMSWLNKSVIPILGKLGQQRHLSSLRDSFGTIIPLIIAGSIAILFITIGFGGWGSEKVSILGWIWMAANGTSDVTKLTSDIAAGIGPWAKAVSIGTNMFAPINSATIGAMSLYISFLLGYFIGLSRGYKQPIMSGFAAFASFIIITMGQFLFFTDAKGLFSAIIAGFIGSELLIAFTKIKQLELKLPQGVPPAVGKSFSVFIPMLITLVIMGILNVIIWAPINFATSYDVFTVDQRTFNPTALGTALDEAIKKETGPLQALLQNMKNALTAGTLNDWINANKDNVNYVNALNAILFNGSGVSITSNHLVNTFATFNTEANILIIKFEITQIPTNVFGLGAGIYRLLQSPFLTFVSSNGGIGVAILFVFLVGLFWFFGIHGSNITAAIFEPIWWAILGVNAALVQQLGLDAAQKEMVAFSKPFFDSYMYIGGSGATLALVISTLIISKRKELKEVAKFSLPAGIFQINEPVIFGYPIILNPLWIVPFIFCPIFNVIIAWLCVSIFHIVGASYIATPWTAPWFIGALLSTGLDWRALLLSLFCFAVTFVFWFPAVMLDNKLYKKRKNKESNNSVDNNGENKDKLVKARKKMIVSPSLSNQK